MFQSIIASVLGAPLLLAATPVTLAATPLAATSDEIKPWMIVAIAAGALLALILIIVAARKSSKSRGDDLRVAMSGGKQDNTQDDGSFNLPPLDGSADAPATSEAPSATVAPVTTKSAAKSGKKGHGKHAK